MYVFVRRQIQRNLFRIQLDDKGPGVGGAALFAVICERTILHPGLVYTSGIYHEGGCVTTTAKLFKNGRSQAVPLPREFRFEGDRVRVRRAGPWCACRTVFTDVSAWFAELDRLASEPFMPEGRQQPSMPQRDVFDDDLPA